MIEVLKQALEALKDVGVLTDREWQAVHKNKANELRQAIAELESQEPVAVYGYCPECGAKGVMRERRPGGNDKCANGHTYQSCKATHPQQLKPLTDEEISTLWNEWKDAVCLDHKTWAKAIEAHHGIKE
jgi:hypothetical protein